MTCEVRILFSLFPKKKPNHSIKMNASRANGSKPQSTRARPVPKTPLSKRATSPPTKQKIKEPTPRSRSTPKQAYSPPPKTKPNVNSKKIEYEHKTPESKINHYQKELNKIEKKSAIEGEQLKREIEEMQSLIDNGMQPESVQKEISLLQKQRDDLKRQIAERNRNQNEMADITKEYNDLEAQLDSLRNVKLKSEEEMTRIMAVNDVLLEHMKNSPKYASFKENAKLRIEKRRLTEKLLQCSEDICQQRGFRAKSSLIDSTGEVPTQESLKQAILENEKSESLRLDLLTKISQIKIQREKELFEAFRREASDAFSQYESSKNEIVQLEQKEELLQNELSHLQSTSRSDISFDEIKAIKNQYRQAREEYINVQQEYHKNLVWELQLRIENETNQLRQNAANQINEMKNEQSKLRETFLSLQDAYNVALANDDDTITVNGSVMSIEKAQNEIDRIQKEFGNITEQIEQISSEEAKKEIDLTDQEYHEMQDISSTINKWISDLHLSTLQSQSKEEALRSQIDILNRKSKNQSINYEHEMSLILEKAQKESQRLNEQLADSKRRLRELDVMLGAPDTDDVSLEQRFQSIQERIAALLDDSDDSSMKLDRLEEDLKAELERLKATKK